MISHIEKVGNVMSVQWKLKPIGTDMSEMNDAS